VMSENRKKQFKQGVDPESQTQRRKDRVLELRQKKRVTAIDKRRRRNLDIEQEEGNEGSLMKFEYEKKDLENAIQGICSSRNATDKLLAHLICLRKILSTENHPIKEVVEAGIVPKILSLLESNDDRFKLEAVRCVSNISSGDEYMTSHVVESSPMLLSFLEAPHNSLKKEALYAIGNIAGDVQECRDTLIAQGAILALKQVLEEDRDETLFSTALWAMSNLAKGAHSSALPFQKAGCFPILIELLSDSVADIAGESAWTLAYLTAREDECVDRMISMNLIPAALSILKRFDGNNSLCIPSLRILGNIAAGPDSWIDHLLNESEFLAILHNIISSKDPMLHAMVKEAAWTISSLVGGHSTCRDKVIGAGFLNPVIDLLLSRQFDLQKEAAHAIFNVMGDLNVLSQIASDPRVISSFAHLLRVPDAETVQLSLAFFRAVCEKVKNGSRLVEKSGGLEAIDELHYGPVSPELSREAAYIVDRFFGEDYDDGEAEINENTLMEDQMPPPQLGMGRGKHLTQPAWMK